MNAEVGLIPKAGVEVGLIPKAGVEVGLIPKAGAEVKEVVTKNCVVCGKIADNKSTETLCCACEPLPLAEQLSMILSRYPEADLDQNSILSCLVGEAIKCCILHPVRLEIIFRELEWDSQPLTDLLGEGEEESSGSDDDEDNDRKLAVEKVKKRQMMDEVFSLLENLSWTTVIWNKKTLIGESKSTGNSDNRGGGCGNMGFAVDDFKHAMENLPGITLANLSEVVYRLKGSKYDWWYELYGGFSVEFENESTIAIDVDFGYGS